MNTTQSIINEICPTTTQAWVKRGALIVDVRENSEVALLDFDVPQITHIPLSDFEDRYTELPKEKELVIVCRSGGKSLLAASFLINHGYDPTKVVNMKHGIIRWVQKGFPTKGDTSSVIDSNSTSTCCDNSSAKTHHHSCCNTSTSEGSACC